MSDIITVSELAKKLGVSRQAVYSRLTKDLSSYVKVIDNKKVLNIAVLEYLGVNEVDKNVSSEVDKIVNVLTAELEVKNNQIKSLQEQVTQLTDALQNTTSSLMAAQALHVSSVKQLADGSQSKNKFWSRFRKKKGGL